MNLTQAFHAQVETSRRDRNRENCLHEHRDCHNLKEEDSLSLLHSQTDQEVGTVRRATSQAAAETEGGRDPGSSRAAGRPPREPCPAAAAGASRRRMDRTEAAPRPRASACGGPPCRGPRRGAAPGGPTSAVEGGRGRDTPAGGEEEEEEGGRGRGTPAGEGAAAGGDRRGRGGAGGAEAGRRGSGARRRPGRARRRRGTAMDGPWGRWWWWWPNGVRDLGLWGRRKDQGASRRFEKLPSWAWGPRVGRLRRRPPGLGRIARKAYGTRRAILEIDVVRCHGYSLLVVLHV